MRQYHERRTSYQEQIDRAPRPARPKPRPWDINPLPPEISSLSATNISPTFTIPAGGTSFPIDAYLRSLMRDVGWGFFYGTVNFDNVFGTINHYGTVDMFMGLLNEAYTSANRHYVETFQAKKLKKVFRGHAGRLDQCGLRSLRRAGRNGQSPSARRTAAT